MEQYQIERRLMHVIDTLRMNDSYLLQNDCSERSIVHRLAIYLEQVFPQYNVDCEYNRNLGDKKKILSILPNDLDADEYNLNRLVSPDIIVHERNTNNNLLVVEVKKSKTHVQDSLRKFDFEKLKLFTSIEHGLGYRYGVYIELITSSPEFVKPNIVLFINGSEVLKGKNSLGYMQRWKKF